MNLLHLGLLFMAALAPCAAIHAQDIDNMGNEGKPLVEFNNGYSNLTIYSYHVKFTAEQRLSDNLVQVIAIPQEQGAQFRILNVRFGQMPESSGLSGPAAIVQGALLIRTGEVTSTRVAEVVPIQINTVTDFSMSADTARMMGYPCVQRVMPNSSAN